MVPIAAPSALDLLFSTLANSRKTIDKVNAACVAQGLPPAFTIGENPLDIQGNPAYRFEGFGLIVLPPQLTFYVHYKPESPEHIALGRFAVPIGLGRLLQLKSILNA